MKTSINCIYIIISNIYYFNIIKFYLTNNINIRGFETNILKIRELNFDENKYNSNSSDLILGSNVEVYSIIMLNDQLKNIHGWQPARIKEFRGDFCLVDLYMNGALQSKIVEKKFIRNAIE